MNDVDVLNETINILCQELDKNSSKCIKDECEYIGSVDKTKCKCAQCYKEWAIAKAKKMLGKNV